MSVLIVYARLYGSALKQAAAGVVRNPWTLLLPVSVGTAYVITAGLLRHLGFIGGILLALAVDALVASYLYFVSEIVAGGRVRLDELRRSFGPNFWVVLNLMFVIWVAEILLRMATSSNEHGAVILFTARVAALILLNAVPEVIYQRGASGGLATIQRSLQFIHRNWIEWFVPNLIVVLGLYLAIPVALAHGIPLMVLGFALGAVLHFIMVFRGHLFAELDGSTHRQRMFKYQAQLR